MGSRLFLWICLASNCNKQGGPRGGGVHGPPQTARRRQGRAAAAQPTRHLPATGTSPPPRSAPLPDTSNATMAAQGARPSDLSEPLLTAASSGSATTFCRPAAAPSAAVGPLVGPCHVGTGLHSASTMPKMLDKYRSHCNGEQRCVLSILRSVHASLALPQVQHACCVVDHHSPAFACSTERAGQQ